MANAYLRVVVEYTSFIQIRRDVHGPAIPLTLAPTRVCRRLSSVPLPLPAIICHAPPIDLGSMLSFLGVQSVSLEPLFGGDRAVECAQATEAALMLLIWGEVRGAAEQVLGLGLDW